LDAQSEQKARDLLHQVTAPAPAPQVGANPPDLNGRDAAREKALSEVRRMTNSTASTLNRAQLDADREKEISRIENEVEASRKRRVAAAGDHHRHVRLHAIVELPVFKSRRTHGL